MTTFVLVSIWLISCFLDSIIKQYFRLLIKYSSYFSRFKLSCFFLKILQMRGWSNKIAISLKNLQIYQFRLYVCLMLNRFLFNKKNPANNNAIIIHSVSVNDVFNIYIYRVNQKIYTNCPHKKILNQS
jgi:hypothetical protein